MNKKNAEERHWFNCTRASRILSRVSKWRERWKRNAISQLYRSNTYSNQRMQELKKEIKLLKENV